MFTYGAAHFYGSMGAANLNQPVFSMAATKSGKGYWLVARDGGIFTFGDAPFCGSLPSLGLNVTDVVGMAPTPSGKGYWIAEANGVVHAFGDATNFGKYGNYVPQPDSACDHVVGIFSNPHEMSYRLVLEGGAAMLFGQGGGGDFEGFPRCVTRWTRATSRTSPADSGYTMTNPFSHRQRCASWPTWNRGPRSRRRVPILQSVCSQRRA